MKKLIVLCVSVAFFVATHAPLASAYSVSRPVSFSDVPRTDYWFGYIDDIASRNIASGAGDGTFGPERAVTRAEATKFIANTVGLLCDNYANTEPDFSDTGNSVGLKKFIACFQSQGYIDGYGDGRFGPQDPVRKAELVKMLLNASGIFVDMTKTHDFPNLQDDTLTPYIVLAGDIGFIYSGDKPDLDANFDNPQLLRRDVAQYLSRFIGDMYRLNLSGTYNIPERAPSTQTITYFLVSNNVGDMNDLDQYMVSVDADIIMTDISHIDFINAALTELFSLDQSQYGNNTNFLHESDVSVESVQYIPSGYGVELNGNIVGMGVLADPFIKEQIIKTIEYYTQGSHTIKLNGSEENWECLFDMSGLCGM